MGSSLPIRPQGGFVAWLVPPPCNARKRHGPRIPKGVRGPSCCGRGSFGGASRRAEGGQRRPRRRITGRERIVRRFVHHVSRRGLARLLGPRARQLSRTVVGLAQDRV